MASWAEFSVSEPVLAAAIRDLIHQYGPGLGYLATIRRDGGPRVHPVSPVITHGGLFCFVLASPKRDDLERDGRYALHSFPPEDTDNEAYLSGTARRVLDQRLVARMATAMRAARHTDWRLYELSVEVAMLARRDQGAGPYDAHYQIWREPVGRGRAAAC